MTIATLRLEPRAVNALMRTGLVILSDLLADDAPTYLAQYGLGVISLQRLARRLLDAGLHPSWLPGWVASFEYQTVAPDVARERGYQPLTAPYGVTERVALEVAMSQLRRGGADFVTVRETRGGLSLWRKKIRNGDG